MENRTEMELREEAITAHYPAALTLLTGFDHAPRLAQPAPAPPPDSSPPDRPGALPPGRRFRSTTPGLAGRRVESAHGVELRARIEGIGGADLPSAAAATVLLALRRAIAIALALGDAVAARSGAAELKRDNLDARLDPARRTELEQLLAAESLAVLSVFANATSFLLAEHAGTEVVRIAPLRELLTDSPYEALRGALWALDREIARHGADEATLIATVLGFAETLSAAVADRAQTTPRVAAFTGASWRVAADDFPISGFAPATRARGSSTGISFRTPQEVVGNAIAKHQMMRLAQMIVAYDFDRRMNPFVELGGFIFTFLGDGKPGTGKTTLIQMMAGLIHGYCEVAGYPFRYRNFSIDQVDSYQGKSAQNARAFIDAVIDPGVIGFGTLDDIDQIAGRRGDRQSSSGQQEITAVLMEAFAGASTVLRGNATFGMFSNHAENIDDALRQRAGARFEIDGPQSRDDYIDILALLLGPRHDIPPGDHDPMAAQHIRPAAAEGFARHDRPQEPALAEIWAQITDRQGPPEDLAELGRYLHAISEADPRFTGRAVKNITDAVKARAMDFDMPPDWFERPEPFLHQRYEVKLAMISELRRPVTAQMVVQEINRYADSELRYAESSDARAIEEAVRDMERRAEAQRRFEAGRR